MSFSGFLDYMQFEKKYSKHTVVAYQNDLQCFSEFLVSEYEQQDVQNANYSQIRSWIIHLVNVGLSNRSVNRKLSTLKTYYKFLVKTKQLDASPMAKHKALKTDKKLQVPFSRTEIDQVMALFHEDTFEGTRNKLIVELLYTTGIRRAELINIKLADINLAGKSIKVLGKRNKERVIPLLKTVASSIKTYLPYREEKETPASKNFLFISKKGVKLYETFVYRVINNYFSQVSGKVKKSPHILRHSFATHLLNEGANLNAVKELLGHASLASTQVYTQNSMAELQKVHANSHPRNQKK